MFNVIYKVGKKKKVEHKYYYYDIPSANINNYKDRTANYGNKGQLGMQQLRLDILHMDKVVSVGILQKSRSGY